MEFVPAAKREFVFVVTLESISDHIPAMDQCVTTSDVELLRRYLRDQNENAFAEVVRRHIDWIYGLALRQVRDPGDAEDATQAVFILLLRKFSRFRESQVLGPWLFRSTLLICRDVRKKRRRLENHERKAAEMRSAVDADENWPSDLSCRLDRAIGRLRNADRQAIVLRFFQGLTHSEIGKAFGISEEAAKMRLSRAVQKLRRMLNSPATPVPAVALETVLMQKPSAAPEGLIRHLLESQAGTSAMALAQLPSNSSFLGLKIAVAMIVAGGASLGVVKIALNRSSATTAVTPITHAATLPAPRYENFITGNVRRPGLWLVRPTTIRQAILRARPVPPLDANTVILVFRHSMGREDAYRYLPVMNPPTRTAGIFPLDRKIENMDIVDVYEDAKLARPIAAGDLLVVAVADPDQPGDSVDLRLRVTESGQVDLPQIGAIKLAGQAMPEAEQTIRSAYAKANIIPSALVSVARLDPFSRPSKNK
jgi:RNA polymerase sigma factor (sigma-70 family)